MKNNRWRMIDNIMNKAKPLVSVICITYGHEKYIAQALDSFLMQKTSFPFQILVGEDKGPDRTAEIVLDYAKRYPDKIIPFIREKNMGAQGNLIDLCRRAGTEYLAFCEGDDYWIDEYKLQKQYDLMESHPEYRACFHNTVIMADSSWYLYKFYKQDRDGNIYLPESIPNYDTSLRELTMDYYIKFGPAHTSSLFYRWDDNRKIPEWYYKHIYGDHSLVMIQVGEGIMGYLPDTMSVYRRSEVGVLMHESKTDHFLKSRADWIEMAVDIERYFVENYNAFAVKEIRERIAVEFDNYIRYIVAGDRLDLLEEVYRKYAYPASLATKEHSRCRRELNVLMKEYSSKGLGLLLKNNNTKNEVKTVIDNVLDEKKKKKQKKTEDKITEYVRESVSERNKATWVFGQNDRKSFKGNVRHLYEYIVAFHPEIEAVWLTGSRKLIKFFEAESLPCAKIGTKKCSEIMRRVGVVFTDCFITKAFDVYGFNKDIKVVRLGEGGSLIGPYFDSFFDKDPRIMPGACAEDVIRHHAEKFAGITLTENNRAYFTENYTNTFLQIATNQKAANIYEKEFGISGDNIFISGSPQSYAVKEEPIQAGNNIILAPGWRETIYAQEEYLRYLVNELENINNILEKEDANLCIYFNKNYLHDGYKILIDRAEQHARITIRGEEYDIYHDLCAYSAMITDWSSTMFDFMLQNKPVILLKTGLELVDSHPEFIVDYDNLLPGEVAMNWEEAIRMSISGINDNLIDAEKREKLLNEIYDMSANDKNNSERIISEVKRRLELP